MAVKKSAKMKRKSQNGSSRVSTKKLPAIKEPLSKSALMRLISETTDISKKQVVHVFDTLTEIVEKCIKTGGPGVFVLPGLVKFRTLKKPARPARKGINPFTGEQIMIKAKPASRVVKVKPLKKLKELVA